MEKLSYTIQEYYILFTLFSGATCKNPGIPDFGKMYPNLNRYDAGQTVEYSCKPGYKLRGAAKISCDESGIFLEQVPTCESKL